MGPSGGSFMVHDESGRQAQVPYLPFQNHNWASDNRPFSPAFVLATFLLHYFKKNKKKPNFQNKILKDKLIIEPVNVSI